MDQLCRLGWDSSVVVNVSTMYRLVTSEQQNLPRFPIISSEIRGPVSNWQVQVKRVFHVNQLYNFSTGPEHTIYAFHQASKNSDTQINFMCAHPSPRYDRCFLIWFLGFKYLCLHCPGVQELASLLSLLEASRGEEAGQAMSSNAATHVIGSRDLNVT